MYGNLVRGSSDRRDGWSKGLKGILGEGILNRRSAQITFIGACCIHILAYVATEYIHMSKVTFILENEFNSTTTLETSNY